jgi:FAD/FMN-containing dehydrogenase
MYEFVERTRERLADVPEASACGYGHLGDGNLHLNVMVPKHSQEVVDLLEPWYVSAYTVFSARTFASCHVIGS